MARKHYRAAKKKSEYVPSRGLFIPNKQKPKLVALAVGALIFVFLKGLLIGFIAGKHD